MDHFIEEYFHILSDPAHLAVEITIMILLDFIFLGLIYPILKSRLSKALHKEHKRLDAEHGVTHHGDHVHRGDVDPTCASE